MKPRNHLKTPLHRILKRYRHITDYLRKHVYFGRSPAHIPEGSIVFFPLRSCHFYCGLAGIVAFKKQGGPSAEIDLSALESRIDNIEAHGSGDCLDNSLSFGQHYLGGDATIRFLYKTLKDMKTDKYFKRIYFQKNIRDGLSRLSQRIDNLIERETRFFSTNLRGKSAQDMESVSPRIETLKDAAWCLREEILANIQRVGDLMDPDMARPGDASLLLFKRINAVMNSINRLEVRGRDSAGLSLLFIFEDDDFKAFQSSLCSRNLVDQFNNRSKQNILRNRGISLNGTVDENGNKIHTVTFVYKIAEEIGSLGDNIAFLRNQIRKDAILQTAAHFPLRYHTISSHTRWASVGAITEANCHPVDNCQALAYDQGQNGIIHVCLNGDIDNFQALKEKYQAGAIPEEITTDTKIIPLQIEHYIQQGHEVAEAFRLAVNDFEGSHAISMHTDLSPGKLFLAQKGSGQAIFVGLAPDHFMPVSEVYGFIEETSDYLKLDGEKIVDGEQGQTQGQIFILDQSSTGGIDGIRAMHYDGSARRLTDNDIIRTDITSRDIDRQNYPHYFLKEISESPSSVEKTLHLRWKLKNDSDYELNLDHTVIPPAMRQALQEKVIRRILFIGQGTAGVAAKACSDILNYYINDPSIQISFLKSSELSGFHLSDDQGETGMADTLVIAISQSGTTTDTNRCVDMVKVRGAHTMAIVNRRESDLTFKVDGVIYTSSGRDIEMSVASTKAFYSQIVAGALLGLFIAQLKGRRDAGFISRELHRLLMLPDQMRTVLSTREQIAMSARRLATTKTYWATVGSGPNKAAADEIRIKLSELCYKTISSDFIEDKKHIDLSSEPLIVVCAAGTSGAVIGDIIKDTAIFKAHKASPVVIADHGETRFSPYAEDVLSVPTVSPHLSPILNTLVGHIWGYYAALTIHEGSQLLFQFRNDLQRTLDAYAADNMDVYEVVLEKPFREKIMAFYKTFRDRKARRFLSAAMGINNATDLILLLKYLSGRLPVSDFELDFGVKGTALNMLNALFASLGKAINILARPVDAIKHQAKTVTVGTSRISNRTEGILFDALAAHDMAVSQLVNRNIAVLKNLQHIVADIKGAIFYRISDLNLLGEPSDETKIEVIRKEGVLKPIPSRVETDRLLKGTKRIIVRQGNVYIGKGRKDDRSIIVIPALSSSPALANRIEYLLLLNIDFKKNVSLARKIKALGGKYEHIKNIVHENSLSWDDRHLEMIEMPELFGRSAEKIGEGIVDRAA